MSPKEEVDPALLNSTCSPQGVLLESNQRLNPLLFQIFGPVIAKKLSVRKQGQFALGATEPLDSMNHVYSESSA